MLYVCSASDNGQLDLVRFRDSGLRSAAASAAEVEVEEILGMGPSSKEQIPENVPEKVSEDVHEKISEDVHEKVSEKIPDQEGAEETVKLRNMDTGEDIELAEIKDRVPPSLDPGELFRTKNLP